MPRDPLSRLSDAYELCAMGRYDRALRLLSVRVPAPVKAQRHYVRAEALRGQGYFRAAAQEYRHALHRTQGEERDLIFGAWLGLTRCLRSLGDTKGARAAIARARRVPGGDDEELALEAALVLRAESRHRAALRELGPMLSVARGRRDWAAVGFILWAVAGSRRFCGQLAASHRDFKAALAAFRRTHDSEAQAYALFGLGGIARIRGRFDEARRAYEAASRKLKGGADLFGRAYAHCGLANCLRQQGRLDFARKHYLLSYALYARLDDKVDLAFVDWGLGQIHQRRGELPHAQRRYRAALASFSKGGEDRGLVLARKSLAEILHARGSTKQAERLFDSAVRLSRLKGLTAHLEPYT
ncbi:MAG: tetratricopeptide repeat protein [Elusimicrobiota bacterium]